MIKSVVNDLMGSLGLNYQYWEFEDIGEGIPSCYFVGERVPSPVDDEGGSESGDFILSGWSRSGLTDLDAAESALKALLNAPGGDYRVTNDDGACVVWYSHTVDVPSDVDGMCRVEMTLGYREWS